ncbi:MAG: GNAT family N-acetyltransferase [Mycoplasmatota bacterium]|nr:GNAT family N-acetyltransferase [Mycoplasmatota bacterium]
MIEIHNIEELIKENYPPEVIEKLLMDVLVLSMKVKDDYPDYRTWYQTIQIPGIYNGTRNIIIAHIKERIVGFISLKKTSEEKKICTFYVEKNFRRNKIGMLLAAKAVEYLEEDKPLITIPLDKLNEFAHIAAKYDWQISDIKENLYRLNNPEVIVNGELKQENLSLEKRKSLKKTYKLYKFIRLKTILSTKFVERKNKIQLG